MLRRGGNAVDAAVAAAFASFVTESALVNIGGGGVAQVFDPASGQAVSYDFFSAMPGLAANNPPAGPALDFRKIMVDFGAAQQPFYIGRGSVAVPGVVAGLSAMLVAQGRLSLAEVLAPAVKLAREGVVLNSEQAYITSLLAPIWRNTPELTTIFSRDGRGLVAGERLHFPGLAETLLRLGEAGPALFYTGPVAQEIVADQQRHGGLLTEADLSSYQVRQHNPITVTYRGYTVLLPPPCSAGGPLIAFALNLLADQPLPSLAHNGASHLRLLAEVMRLTNVARAHWEQASPTQAGPPLDHLLGPKMIRQYSGYLQDILAGAPPPSEPGLAKGSANTTHISVADDDGLVVSITTSAGESAGFVVGQTGIMLNNMLGEIDLHFNGFHQLPPGQRLTTMMSPAIILQEGQPVLVVGSGGSNRLRSAIVQTISNVLDFGLPLAEAVAAPRIHFEENVLQLEGGIGPDVAQSLAAGGYQVNRWPARNMFFGGAHAVARQPDNHSQPWVAVGDARRGGAIAAE
jgi:gamma-glutamyltranspeptidase/glutathione hydrolase